jgi:hypothetical protein
MSIRLIARNYKGFENYYTVEAKSANVGHRTFPEMEAETMIFHSISRQLGSKMLAGHLTAGQTITPIP